MALRKRLKFGLAAVAGLLVAAGVAVVLLTVTGTHQGSASAVGFSSAEQARLQRGLTAPSIAAQSRVVAAEIRAQFIGRGRLLLPAGSRVHIEPATFDARSVKTATVDAIITGPKPGHWQLLLINESGNWQLIGTKRLP
jgi:hypothetical protein